MPGVRSGWPAFELALPALSLLLTPTTTSRPARIRILHHPAPGKSRRTQRTRPLARLPRPLHPERLCRHRPRPAQGRLRHLYSRRQRPYPHHHEGKIQNFCENESNDPIDQVRQNKIWHRVLARGKIACAVKDSEH